MRVALTENSKGDKRIEILLGEMVYVISLEKGKELADWIYEVHPAAEAETAKLKRENEKLKEWSAIENSYAHMFLIWMRLVKEHSEELYWELFDKAIAHFDALLADTQESE